jgi:flagellum-specific peptidoglycan hydrolase FlgJ
MRILCSSAAVLVCTIALSQSGYFEKYQSLTDSLEEVYGIPSSLMMGVAYHESGGGTSRNAKLLNNHFGIVGSNNLLATHGIQSRYRWFSSDTAGYIGFCELVSRKKFYTKLKGTTDISKWVYALHSAGYCPSSTWPERVLAVIRKNKLT